MTRRQSYHPWNVARARAWHLFMPPARPSQGEVAQYERLLISEGLVRRRKWILLGCTPELRSVAARYQREILCIDRNDRVFEALRSMVSPEFSESFLCSEWLQLRISAPVDVVLGDGSLNMVAGTRHRALLKKIAGILKPGGAAILRVHMLGSARFSTPGEVFEWYRSCARGEPVFSATRTHLDMLWVDRRTGRINFPEYHQKINRLYRSKIISRNEFEAYNRLLRFNKIKMYYVTRQRFENMAREWFTIGGAYASDDYTGAAYHPIYFLRKL
jgi:hypothetical protein